ncbi:hypothetical protein NM208_g1160 [Fusarium decemcellulare]|uniref:Uncharacterized protein n=1 Tax=Fusarium decemcellulare TaxID=57161 RepID=A0ACC1SX53_9HYPO|nr:hypothetical protein NM208_g1160 [Fusarium decemcellulare]
MPSLSNIITSLTCLVAVVNAMPASRVARQHHTDCETGKYYFSCGKYNGCYAKDPCVLPPTSKTETPGSTDSECPAGTQGARLAPSAIYEVFPKHPSLAKDTVSAVHLETYDNASQVEQVLVFSGIPTEAKSCSFGWSQGERIDRTFIAKGSNGLANIRQLSGLPKEGADVTYNAIKPFDDAEESLGSADFTNWDDLGPNPHGAGSFNCAETVYFKVALTNADGNTQVYLGQDKDNGYQVTYSC